MNGLSEWFSPIRHLLPRAELGDKPTAEEISRAAPMWAELVDTATRSASRIDEFSETEDPDRGAAINIILTYVPRIQITENGRVAVTPDGQCEGERRPPPSTVAELLAALGGKEWVPASALSKYVGRLEVIRCHSTAPIVGATAHLLRAVPTVRGLSTSGHAENADPVPIENPVPTTIPQRI